MNNETSVSIKFSNSVTGEKKLEKYAETLNKINSILGAIDTGKAKALDGSVKNLTKEDTKKNVKDMGKAFDTAFNTAKITTFIASINKLTKTISGYTKKSATYLENMNLLDVAFGNNTNEAKQFINTLSEMYGLDESWGTRTVGIFKQLANAMGLADEVGTKMSKTLTQLAIDTSSLYNIDVEDTVSILQSALAGQTKPSRRLGADITQSTLQLTMDTAGIDRAVEGLTYAEKRLVIVASLLNQTQQSFGDWGRTIESIANQMRIFQQQTERLTRALGNMFLPILKVILPYLNAFLMVLTEIINWFAVLIGYNEEDFDFFGKTDQSVLDLSDGLASATENAKKLKSGLRGFDKLNNITTPSNTGTGVGAGAGGVDPEILNLFNKASDKYMGTLDKVQMKATKIRDKIMDWLGFTKVIDKATGKVSFKFDHITSGTVLGALAVGGTIYSGISKITGFLLKISGIQMPTFLAGLSGNTVAIIAGVAVALGLMAYSLYDLYQKNDEFANSVNEKLAGIKTAIQPIIENILELFETLKMTYEETLKPMIEEIYGIIQTIATTLLEILYPVFTDFILPVIEQVIQIINDLFAIINELWESYGKPISEAVQEAISGIADIFLKLWEEFLKPIIEKIMVIIEDLWTNTLKPMAEKIGGIIGSLIELILALWNNVLEPIVKWLIDVLAPIFEWAFNFIGDVIHTVAKFIGGIINGILDVLKGVIDFLVGIFTLDFKRAWDGIVGILKGVGNIIISIFEGVVNLVIDLINGLIKAVYNGVKSLINTVLGGVEAVADFLGYDIDITLKGKAPQIPKLTIPRLKTGLDFVPNDYYPAYLDYGERVLTKEQNADYNKGIINGQSANNGRPINATFVIKVGDKEIAKQVINDLQDIAKDNGKPITIGG